RGWYRVDTVAAKQWISAEKCARKIIRAIKRSKKEVYIGGTELLMVFIKKYFPRFFYLISSKIKPT
ncbi:MAG: hypothetical protein JSV22_08545, partial [Bacteroidales bacterium]